LYPGVIQLVLDIPNDAIAPHVRFVAAGASSETVVAWLKRYFNMGLKP
jgi:hypothetical protein